MTQFEKSYPYDSLLVSNYVEKKKLKGFITPFLKAY